MTEEDSWRWYTVFFCLDHPKEVAIEPQTAIEGDDVTLTCRATRYVYTGLQWLDSRNKTITSNVSNLQMNRYSISLSLNVRNVSQNSTAGYQCRAYKLHSLTQPIVKMADLEVEGKSE